MFKIVNGYPCTSGCDVDLARRNVDPRNPRNDPVKAAELEKKDPAKALAREIREAVAGEQPAADRSGAAYGPAVLYSGSLAAPAAGPPSTAAVRPRVDILV